LTLIMLFLLPKAHSSFHSSSMLLASVFYITFTVLLVPSWISELNHTFTW
jgi:hypothetical protein